MVNVQQDILSSQKDASFRLLLLSAESSLLTPCHLCPSTSTCPFPGGYILRSLTTETGQPSLMWCQVSKDSGISACFCVSYVGITTG